MRLLQHNLYITTTPLYNTTLHNNHTTGRADAAEAELKERDARELAQLTTAEEKALLKTQIAKQRDQITLKAKVRVLLCVIVVVIVL